MRSLILALSALLAISAPASAEIIVMHGSDNLPMGYRVPKLPVMKGWKDVPKIGFVKLIPDGTEDATTPISLTALAESTDQAPIDNIDDLFRRDREDLQRGAPDTITTRLSDIADADGQKFTVYSFNTQKGWVARAYGVEDNYLLTFSLTARTKADYDKNFAVFADLVKRYAYKLR